MSRNLLSWIILVLLAITWGSSFILIKKGLVSFSSDEVGALRIIISFLFLLPLAILRIRRVKRKDFLYLFIVGLVGSVAPAFLFAKAQTGIDSNLAGILNSLTSLFTLIVGLSFFGLKTKWFNVLGVFLALMGAVGLISVSGDNSFTFNLTYSAYVIIATICYAFNVNIVKNYLKHLDSIAITSVSFFMVGLPLIAYLFLFTDFSGQIAGGGEALAGLAYISILAVVGTGLALMAFNYLIKISSPIFASSVTYLIPVVAIMWGVFDGETFKPNYLIWVLLILLGVILVNTNYQNRFFKRLTSRIKNTKK